MDENKKSKSLKEILKFFLVSSIVGIVQLILVNVLYFGLKSWTAPLPDFLKGIFSASVVGAGHDNWGYVLPFFLSNAIANVYGYFKTEKQLSGPRMFRSGVLPFI